MSLIDDIRAKVADAEVRGTMANQHEWREEFVERQVTYTLEMDGRFFVIEVVPARVSPDTGEQLFSPQTVERLKQMIRGDEQPVRVIQTPVYQFVG